MSPERWWAFGEMYVFPGWLEHGVEENMSERDRISFNVAAFPKC